jgi:murein L,D-transpeptidase YcbB/YkuD
MTRLESITKKIIFGSTSLFAAQTALGDISSSISSKQMDANLETENIIQNNMGPKLVLKINDNTNTFALLFHRSHRSHSSHRSHYSSYSGSEEKKPAEKKVDVQSLGSRLLFKGITGKDVVELRKLLKAKGYKLDIENEKFDEKLEVIVMDYQVKQSLKADGQVGPLLIYYLKQD